MTRSQAHLLREHKAPSNGEDDTTKTWPQFTGNLVSGQTLTAVDPIITGDTVGNTFTRQWYRNGVAIAGATNPTYVLQAADVGKMIIVEYKVLNAKYPTKTRTSPARGPIA